MTEEQTAAMREGFEEQRKAGINVDWFTWQIAWADARAITPAPPSDTAVAKPDEQEMTALNVAIMVLKKEGILQNAYALENLRNRLAATPASIADTAMAKRDAARYQIARSGKALTVRVPVKDKLVTYCLTHKPEEGYAEAFDAAVDTYLAATPTSSGDTAGAKSE